jgi:hypothetical protein
VGGAELKPRPQRNYVLTEDSFFYYLGVFLSLFIRACVVVTVLLGCLFVKFIFCNIEHVSYFWSV